jgi:hypothetical protein
VERGCDDVDNKTLFLTFIYHNLMKAQRLDTWLVILEIIFSFILPLFFIPIWLGGENYWEVAWDKESSAAINTYYAVAFNFRYALALIGVIGLILTHRKFTPMAALVFPILALQILPLCYPLFKQIGGATLFFPIPFAILVFLRLAWNNWNWTKYIIENQYDTKNKVLAKLYHFLTWSSDSRLLIYLTLFLPLHYLINLIFMFFGFPYDHIDAALRETCGHPLSLRPCYNVEHNGHYLCTIAARGHQNIVQPQRLGHRDGQTILVNRQLMVANAFEQLIEQRLPRTHHIIRSTYDKGISFYKLLNNSYLSDFIYLLMKPLEWIFLLVIYTFDQHPEKRIRSQYLK